MNPMLSPTQAKHHDGDGVLLAPKDLASAVEAVSRLAHDAARDARRTRMAGSDFLRVTDPAVEATLRPAAITNDQVPTDRPSLGKRTARTFARFMLAACIGVAGTLAWQASGEAVKRMMASWAPQLGWLSSLAAMSTWLGSEIALKPPRAPAVQVAAADATPAQPAPLATTTPHPVVLPAPAAPSELVQQPAIARDLATMRQSVEQLLASQEQMAGTITARDFVAVRQSLEQLTASQERMAQDIAKLLAAQRDIWHKLSEPPLRPVAASARKPVPTTPVVNRNGSAGQPRPGHPETLPSHTDNVR